MKNSLFVILLSCSFLFADLPDGIVYVHPLPESEYVSSLTTLLLRFENNTTFPENQLPELFTVIGSQSGEVSGKTLFSDDKSTIIFKPSKSFVPGETVTVEITTDFIKSGSFFYSFNVSTQTYNQLALSKEFAEEREALKKPIDYETVGEVKTINGVTVPSDFPKFNILEEWGETAPGRLFFGVRQKFFIILENDGTPYFYRRSNDFLMDFKVQRTGVLSRNYDNRSTNEHFYATIDQHFNEVDTFTVAHGYHTDHHDFQLLPSGHYFLIFNDYQKVDMSKIVEGGHPNATILGHGIQEFDSNDNVIFEWRGWDHIDILESQYENLRSSNFDYAHINSVDLDYDDEIIISCRNLSQCIKINRLTGERIWTLGGTENSFNFINDEDQNSFQHMFRAVEGKPGNYTLFDNGNRHFPRYSRGVEYKLDTDNITAERVWEFRHDPDLSADWLGSVQRLPNGNSVINWTGHGLPFITEVNDDGDVFLEMKLNSPTAVYRTYRFEWEGVAEKPELELEMFGDKIVFIMNKFGDKNVDHFNMYLGTSPDNLEFVGKSESTRFDLGGLQNDTRYYAQVVSVNSEGVESVPSEIRDIFVRYVKPGENLVFNGHFTTSSNRWSLKLYNDGFAHKSVANGVMQCQIFRAGLNVWDVQIFQENIPVYKNRRYRFEFDASAAANRSIEAMVVQGTEPWTNYGEIGIWSLTTRRKHFEWVFTMHDETDIEALILFNLGGHDADVYIDNVSLVMLEDTGVEQDVSQPADFIVDQNYPNPFNPVTTISYTLNKAGNVSVKIYDIQGRLVDTLIDSQQMPGKYSVEWPGGILPESRFSSGVYFYRVNNGNQIVQKKMLFLK